MTATVIKIKESDGWVNLTAGASLLAGDKLNIQNIGSAGIFLQTSVTEPVDLTGIDYLYMPKENPVTATPGDTESVWGNTQGLGETKLAISDPRVATITDPMLIIASTTKGLPLAGGLTFTRSGLSPAEIIFAFNNTGEKSITSDFLLSASNNSNNMIGQFDIELAFNSEALTGGTDFSTDEILILRNSINIIAKINPTNTVNYAKFERVYVSANGGLGNENIQDFILIPNETLFIKITGFINVVEGSFSARFGRA